MSGLLGSSQWMYASGAEVTQQSLKFNDDESQYLSWTPAAAGNRKTWTWSGWVKRGNLTNYHSFFSGYSSSTALDYLFFNNNDTLSFRNFNGTTYDLVTNAVFRDTSAWYHIVLSVDTTQTTSSDRVKLYVNGELQSLGTATYPSQNYDFLVNSTVSHYIGQNGYNYFDGYLSDIHFIDGQALDADDFGETVDGYWKAKDYAGTYGTNGFRLTFQDDVVSEGFNAVTYRGNGGTQSVSGLGMEADLFWIKERSQANDHVLIDSVRGISQRLESNNTDAEVTMSPVNLITSIDADGFSLGSNGNANESGQTYVAWCWDAGTGSAVSNTDGSITSSVKANTDYGFSIVSYTGNGTSGATVGHGLGAAAPKVILVKTRNQARNWSFNGDGFGGLALGTNFIVLNDTAAKVANTTQVTASSTDTITLGSGALVNNSSDTYVAYCFAEVSGYSSFGSFTGTGASGNTVTCGFRPALVMFKNADDAGTSWYIHDATRDPYPPSKKILFPNENSAEFNDTGNDGVTFTATGFTVDTTRNEVNGSGDNIIYMAFADTREAAFWKDVSGQGNHWTPNNLDYRDSLIDSPANNFAVLQPTAFVNIGGINSAQTLSEGNLRFTGTTSQGRSTPATIRVTSGKYYAEATKTSGTGSVVVDFIVNDARVADKNTSTNGDIIMAAVDVDAGKYWSGLNGTWDSSGDPATGANPTGTFTANSSFTFGGRVFDNARVGHFNFGQDSTFAGAKTAGSYADANGIGSFQYNPESYLALCTSNLPTPTIIDGSEYFNTVLYTGDGNANHSISAVGFSPNWLWIKNRSNTYSHMIYDTIRGAGDYISSDNTNAEATGSHMNSFDSDGFTVSFASSNRTNQNNENYAAWNWLAGGTAVSNTDGSITSQVSANTDAGFSIVSYTGTGSSTTTGHGLNSAPEVVIIKDRDSAQDWNVYHADVGTTNILALNSTSAAYADGAAMINSTAPTSSVVHIGFGGASNGSGRDYIAYCFHSVDGYSKAGSYTGNGSTDGTFVYTGFRPSFILTKRSSGGGAWGMSDTSRSPDNVVQEGLEANTTLAEFNSSNYYHDILSNGFKLRTSDNAMNGSGSTYIYLAFAENPFKYANAR